MSLASSSRSARRVRLLRERTTRRASSCMRSFPPSAFSSSQSTPYHASGGSFAPASAVSIFSISVADAVSSAAHAWLLGSVSLVIAAALWQEVVAVAMICGESRARAFRVVLCPRHRGASTMGTIRRSELDGAVRGGILSAAQADRLVAFLETDTTQPSGGTGPRFSFVHVLYYLGGMIAIGAMSIFMTLGWNALGGWGGFVTALLYAVLALALTHWFLARKQLEVPAGITATLAVVMVPLAIFGAQMALGYWGENKPFRDYHVFIDWRWIMMELGTLAVGAILLWRYRFPFMLMPVAVTLWYMSMDIV